MKFEETYLNDNILDALYDMHFDDMTPIQEQCIPEILDGYDVLGVAQTGTGKTAAYLLPILSELDDGDYPKDAINAVIMSPTRELAQQIDRNCVLCVWAPTYSLPHLADCSVTSGLATSTSLDVHSLYSTRPTACSTWVLSMTS